MGIAERREREKEALRTRIVEAARDIVSAEGLDALSMRAIAERIEYSPATIYLYFRDKEELLREVVVEGFERLAEAVREQLRSLGADADPVRQHRAFGLGYVRFALENTAYFRVMFELPTVARVTRPEECAQEGSTLSDAPSWGAVVGTVRRAIEAGLVRIESAERGAIIAWGLVHGMVSLYLSGHLSDSVRSHEEFLRLVEEAMDSLLLGWAPRESPAHRRA